MIVLIVAIFSVVLVAGYVAEGFGHDSDIPSTIQPPDEPQGGLVQSILAPLKWVYENSIGALIDIIQGIPNGVPAIIIIITTAIISLLIILYLIELIRGKG